MKIAAIKCLKCEQTVYSRAKYDCRFCKCKNVGVSSASNYSKFYIEDLEKYKILSVDIDVTKKALHLDWRYGTNEYGIVND